MKCNTFSAHFIWPDSFVNIFSLDVGLVDWSNYSSGTDSTKIKLASFFKQANFMSQRRIIELEKVFKDQLVRLDFIESNISSSKML